MSPKHNPAVEAVRSAVQQPGEQLDSHTRDTMQPLYGFDFSQVRIHRGPHAEHAAQAAGATALTTGNHVVLGPGAGWPVLAHELAHVAQQRGGSAEPQRFSAYGDGDEVAADHAAQAALDGR